MSFLLSSPHRHPQLTLQEIQEYRVGLDCVKCVVCYNLGREECERFIRYGMEFKVMWNKNAQRNKILLSFQ